MSIISIMENCMTEDLTNALVPQNNQLEEMSNDDLAAFLGDLDGSASNDERIKASRFASENPGAVSILLKMPDLSKVNEIIQNIDTAMFHIMDGSERFTLDKITLVKKSNPKQPEFRVGNFKIGENDIIPKRDIDFLPLFAYPSRVYFADYDSGDKPRSICNSTNNFKGLFKGEDITDTPYVKDCATCPYKEWGSKADGSVDSTARTRPLCRQQWTFIGVTPEFNALYEMVISGYCLGIKSYNAHNKMLTSGRMGNIFQPTLPDVNDMELSQYRIHKSRIDINSCWLSMTGEVIENNKKQIVSAATLVYKTDKVLTKEQLIYTGIYLKLGQIYIQYLMETFNNFLNKTDTTSVIDVEGEVVEDIVDEPVMDIVDNIE